MSKIMKIVVAVKESIGHLLYGKEVYTKIVNSKVFQENQLKDRQLKELKKEVKRLREEIRHESDKHKRKELEQRLCDVNKIIKKLQEELSKCKEKIMTGCISIPLSPVLVPLLTTHDRCSVIENIVAIDKSKVKTCDVLQSKNMEESYDKYPE